MLKIKTLLNYLDINKNKSFNETVYTFIVRASGIVFGVPLSIFLGRTLGPEGLGIISLTNQIVAILLMLSLLGLPTVVMKEVSIAFKRNNWGKINSVINTAFKIIGVWATFIILLTYLLIPYSVVYIFHEPQLKIPLTIAVFSMVFQIISRILSSGLNGYNKIWQSSLVNDSLSIVIVFITVAIQFFFGREINIVNVAWSYAVSRIFVSLIISFYWKSLNKKTENVKFIPRPILKVALPLLFAQATGVIANSVDSIMIGSLLTAKEVGLYSIARKISDFSSIFLQVTGMVLSPKIAHLFAEKEVKKLEKLLQKITKYLFVISTIILLIIILTGKVVLNIWGRAFVDSYSVLIILSVGQFVSVSAGSVGVVLTLCNQEKTWGKLVLISALLNILFNYFFIKMWGVNGAAVSTAATLIFMNVFGLIIIKKRIGIQLFNLNLKI